MAEGSQRRILQIWPVSTLPNPQTTRLEQHDVHWKSFLWIPHLPSFCSCCLVVESTVNGKNNKENKTREFADMRMYHFSWNFLLQGCDVLWWWLLTWEFFILSTCLTTFSTCELVVDETVDSKDNLEEKAKEVADIRMYHFSKNFLRLGRDMLWWWWLTSTFFILSTWATTLGSIVLVVDKDN